MQTVLYQGGKMIKKIKNIAGIALFMFLIVGGMVGPFFYTPTFDMQQGPYVNYML